MIPEGSLEGLRKSRGVPGGAEVVPQESPGTEEGPEGPLVPFRGREAMAYPCAGLGCGPGAFPDGISRCSLQAARGEGGLFLPGGIGPRPGEAHPGKGMGNAGAGIKSPVRGKTPLGVSVSWGPGEVEDPGWGLSSWEEEVSIFWAFSQDLGRAGWGISFWEGWEIPFSGVLLCLICVLEFWEMITGTQRRHQVLFLKAGGADWDEILGENWLMGRNPSV